MDDYLAWYSHISRQFTGSPPIQEGGEASQQSSGDVDEVWNTLFDFF